MVNPTLQSLNPKQYAEKFFISFYNSSTVPSRFRHDAFEELGLDYKRNKVIDLLENKVENLEREHKLMHDNALFTYSSKAAGYVAGFPFGIIDAIISTPVYVIDQIRFKELE